MESDVETDISTLQSQFDRYHDVNLLYSVQVFLRYEKELKDIEALQGVSVRWQPTDHVYKEVKEQFCKIKLAQMKRGMWASVVRRRFLLQMKAKYAGM